MNKYANKFEAMLNRPDASDLIQMHISNVSSSSRNLDPRPDLSRDTILWQQLLASAQDIDQRYRDPEQKLYSALFYMRARGTIIQRIANGKLGLRPQIDPSGNNAWTSQAEYDREKVKVLDPVKDRLIDLLGRMVA